MRYELVDYFDVWGNEKDGYTVNDQTVVMDDLYFSPNSKDDSIIEFLKDLEYLKPNANVYLAGTPEFIEIYETKTDYPIGCLREVA